MEEKTKKVKSIGIKKFSFTGLAFKLLLIGLFLIPLFSLPNEGGRGLMVKPIFVIGVATIISILWLVQRLIDGKFSFQKNLLTISSILVILVSFLSAAMSPEKGISFFGFGYETGTFAFIVVLMALMYLSSNLLDNVKKVGKFFDWLTTSIVLLLVIQVVNIFTTLNFIGLSADNSSLIGRWTDLSIILGLGALISAIKFENSDIKGNNKGIAGIIFLFLLIGTAIVNFSLTWWALLISGGVYLVFRISSEKIADQDSKLKAILKKVLIGPVTFLVLFSIIFVALGRDGDIGTPGGPLNRLSDSIVSSPLEVRPNLEGTLGVAGGIMEDDALLGVGLNRFDSAWIAEKPVETNLDVFFWNAEFDSGNSYITSMLVTSGILGIIAWVIFALLILYGVFRGFVKSNKITDIKNRKQISIGAASSLYLMVMMLIFVPSAGVLAISFMIFGAYMAALMTAGLIKKFDISSSKSQTISFASVLSVVIVLILVVASGLTYTQKALAWSNFQEGVSLVRAGEIDQGVQYLNKAVNLDERDIYYRLLAEAQLIQLVRITEQQGKGEDELRREFQDQSGLVGSNINKAIELNETYYANYMSQARIFQNLIRFGIDGAYEAALRSYEVAKSYAPNNPRIPLELAQLELGLNNREAGEAYLNEALTLKPNYTDAIFLRSQLAIQDGNIEQAIEDTRQAVSLNPTNAGRLFQLAFLYYQNEEYENAASAAAAALNQNQQYANARYFLALSLYELDQTGEALNQFRIIKQQDPNNTDLDQIIENLEAGRAPFAGVPEESIPDLENEPPIDEESSVTDSISE